MAITFKVIGKGEPGVAGGGVTKYYASANSTGEANIDELSELIEMISTVSSIDISAALQGFVKVMPRALAAGDIVRLGDLGYFRISLSSKGHATEEEVSASSVTDTRIIFTPGKELKKMLNNLEFVKANGEVA
jgi:predicted histone-like DNA-binding protein